MRRRAGHARKRPFNIKDGESAIKNSATAGLRDLGLQPTELESRVLLGRAKSHRDQITDGRRLEPRVSNENSPVRLKSWFLRRQTKCPAHEPVLR